MKTAILIPCYNEELTIRQVVKDFQKVLSHAEIYVYDNNSTDRTAQIAEEAGAIVRHEYKQGKGNVVRSMFRDIDADCYIMVDGDDTYPAAFAPKFEQLILEGKADMVVGDRLSSSYFQENKRLFHNNGNRLVRDCVNLLFRTHLKDIMSGARAFSRAFVKSYPVTCNGFELETEMTIFALEHNFRIIEETIDYKDRPSGSVSKLNTISDGAKILATIGKRFCQIKPFSLFSVNSGILVAFCVGIFCRNKEKSMWLDKKAILGVGAGIAAIVSFFTGILLSVLHKQKRQHFEQMLKLLQ